MLDELTHRLEYWTLERINSEVFKNLLNHLDTGNKYVTDITPDGYFLIQPYSCTFFQINTGRIFRLDKSFQPHDWRAQVALYKISQGKFNIDEPVESNELFISNQLCRYSIYQRSGTTTGIDFSLDIGEGIVTKEYIKEFVDQSVVVLASIKAVVNQENVPWTEKAVCLTSRVRVSNTYSWKSFTRWRTSSEFVYKESLRYLEIYSRLAFIMQNQMFETKYLQTEVEECVTYASKKWKSVIF